MNPSTLKNADMLRSERFRTTVRDPPFAYDCMAPGEVGKKSQHQIEDEEVT